METFYDITSRDLDLWDTELDPLHADALKLSSDADMPDWFLERDVKIPHVILHDKLISDALIGTLPIKTEHSYSLNSDGDSMPDSPRSLHTKIEDMDEDCYPAISMSTVTSNSRRTLDSMSSLSQSNSSHSLSSSSHNSSLTNSSSSNQTVNNHHRHSQKMHVDTHLLHSSSMSDNVSTTSSCDEIDIDDTCIKDEPLSPSSSCPSSPVSPAYGINLNMANVAAFTNADLVFEHKNGSLQLSPASQSLLKNQQIILSGSTSLQPQRIVMPKLNIKMEQQSVPTASVFSLPPTPPSSLPSDESEGNQSPDRHLASPMSPPNVSTTQQQSSPVTSTTTSTTTTSHRRGGGHHHSGSNASSISTSTAATSGQHISSSGGRVGYTGSSTRQPIHTPLISSQPKGSTGTLVLTEEEKRTLLAEGYPIPTRLPLTKAEEKSLKKIRRKIKNKISAQESRRKKKEYMDQLERKVELLVSENTDYRKRVETLEDSNANLMNQLSKLQALLSRQTSKKM